MKAAFVVCAVLAISIIVTVKANSGDGRSACKDPSELGQTYPHHFDPAKYWLCEERDKPAKEVDCPNGLAYMHLLKECIPWASYIWKKPENPPTVL